ncbi:MAG: hypothetical protein GC171_09255 [Terrimonas sp.]|nr:hypothetical protein [Terrimonas sp.]
MYKKLNELSFVIGLFFTLVSLILLGDYLLSPSSQKPINLYTGIGLLIFGVFMILVKSSENHGDAAD